MASSSWPSSFGEMSESVARTAIGVAWVLMMMLAGAPRRCCRRGRCRTTRSCTHRPRPVFHRRGVRPRPGCGRIQAPLVVHHRDAGRIHHSGLPAVLRRELLLDGDGVLVAVVVGREHQLRGAQRCLRRYGVDHHRAQLAARPVAAVVPRLQEVVDRRRPRPPGRRTTCRPSAGSRECRSVPWSQAAGPTRLEQPSGGARPSLLRMVRTRLPASSSTISM